MNKFDVLTPCFGGLGRENVGDRCCVKLICFAVSEISADSLCTSSRDMSAIEEKYVVHSISYAV